MSIEKNACENGRWLIKKAVRLIGEKDERSTLTERLFLSKEAWDAYADLPQPLMMGRGLGYILSKCSLPIDPHDLLLGRYVDKVPDEQEEARFQTLIREEANHKNPILFPNGGHLTIDSPALIRYGVPGLKKLARDAMDEAIRSGAADEDLLIWKGMIECLDSFLLYIKRYGEEARACGKGQAADVCVALTQGKPHTFREALQLLIFFFTIYMIYAGMIVVCLNFGRIDQFLYQLYESDIESGRLTEAEAGALIDDFYSKCSLHLGRGEHQMGNPALGGHYTGWDRNPTFDSPTYITLGGIGYDGKNTSNDLTRLMVSHIEPKLKNPVIMFRYSPDIDKDLWRTVVQKASENASFLIYNDEALLPAYRRLNIQEADAVDYTVHPCNWADIGYKNVIVGSVGGYLPLMIRSVLEQNDDISDMDALYAKIGDAFRETVKEPFRAYRERYCRNVPLPVGSCLAFHDVITESCVRRGRVRENGGVDYPALYALLRNIGTAADMLSAVETMVFKTRTCTLKELMAACDRNFEGCPELLKKAKSCPKYGTDDEVADGHAKRLLNECLDILDEESTNEKGVRDVLTLNVTINDMNHLPIGMTLGATPDGRLAGAPLSENLSPAAGHVESITALLNSASKLPYDRIHSGALNVRIREDLVRGDTGTDILVALLNTYFKKGGMQIQLSIADTETLKAAQACPECYRDLTVRITGYSAIFVDMSKNAQDEIIRRDEMA